jgi:uncharacterized membrane protein YhaH (DUF805 family)
MASLAFWPKGEFGRLFQSDEGRIDRAVWARAALFLALALAVATAIWWLLEPFSQRGLETRVFLDPMAFAANLYLVIYALFVILLAISWVNLTAKRMRDRGLAPPVGLAGILPLVALFDGALHWLWPRLAGGLPYVWVLLGDGLALAALVWTLAACCDVTAPRR